MSRLSVIIPTYKRNDLLGECLKRLSTSVQTIASENFEVIVTDDSPTGEAKAFIEKEFPEVKWVQGPCRGPASNRNNGAAKSTGDWLVFLDDDCLPEKGILTAYHEEIANGTAKVLEGKITPDGLRTSPLEYAPVNSTGGHLWSCNFAIEKQLYNALGGFDEAFKYPHLEDNDLNDRLKAKGVQAVFVPEAEVKHPWRKLTSGKKLGLYQEMHIYYDLKHSKPHSFGILFFKIFRVHGVMIKNAFFSRDLPLAIKLMIDHLFTFTINYRRWYKLYVGKR